jgi:SAM-dependent methyltransferase
MQRRGKGWTASLRGGRALACALAASAVFSSARAAEPAGAGAGLIDQLREKILAHADPRPGMVVAEIGVGGGWFVVRVGEAIGPNGVLYGTDIDPEAIARIEERIPNLAPASARVELRLCRDARDTALDDLPDGRLDLIFMIDSLCFDGHEPRERDVAYLRRFLRILRPGGRLVHHMDCTCAVAPSAVAALFRDAGFSQRVETLDVAPDPALVDASWPCRSAAERERHAFVGIFRKPQGGEDKSP